MELKNRIDFVYIFDIQDGNPNGDPDNGNQPRVDPETGLGLVTDVCLKRKVRNYVQVAKQGQPGFDIFIRESVVLNDIIEDIFESNDVAKYSDKKDKGVATRNIMCQRFFDVRSFGAVISVSKLAGLSSGQVRGPIQLTFARSVSPINAKEHTITRVARNKDDKDSSNSMGRKSTVPYGLYICHGFISANLAKQTGFSTDDLQLFFDALRNMFDLDRSAARGLMSARRLIVFEHASELGNAPANLLFDRVAITQNTDVPRAFADYTITVNADNLPAGVTIKELI